MRSSFPAGGSSARPAEVPRLAEVRHVRAPHPVLDHEPAPRAVADQHRADEDRERREPREDDADEHRRRDHRHVAVDQRDSPETARPGVNGLNSRFPPASLEVAEQLLVLERGDRRAPDRRRREPVADDPVDPPRDPLAEHAEHAARRPAGPRAARRRRRSPRRAPGRPASPSRSCTAPGSRPTTTLVAITNPTGARPTTRLQQTAAIASGRPASGSSRAIATRDRTRPRTYATADLTPELATATAYGARGGSPRAVEWRPSSPTICRDVVLISTGSVGCWTTANGYVAPLPHGRGPRRLLVSGQAGVRPWRRMIAANSAGSGGPVVAPFTSAASSRK